MTKRIVLVLLNVLYTLGSFSQEASDSSLSEMTYTLGEVVIRAESGISEVSASEIRLYNSKNVSTALKILPSISVNRFGSRNESTIYLHGFDIRSVPVFIDGIPVYVPYDGYVDLARFTTFDISKIDVEKGFSSVSYGPNAIGGVINLISRKPARIFELETGAGLMNGRGYESVLTAGSRLGRFYIQSGLSFLNRQYLQLSQRFVPNSAEDDHRRDNSAQSDSKISIKIGYIPDNGDEYSINYLYSHGEKGNPVYAGSDRTIRVRFWQWPYWDKQSIYHISRTSFGEKSTLKTRVYFDQFMNKLSSFDDNTYSSQTRGSSFNSFYNDYTAGGNLEYSNDMFSNHHIVLAAHFKNDNHAERNNSDAWMHYSDNTWSIGAEDIYKTSDRMSFIPGFSYNVRQGLRADQVYNSGDKMNKVSRSANAQILARYELRNVDIDLIAAYKSRFATMKDRYSYRSGTGLPNPELKPENALNLSVSSNMRITDELVFQPELFASFLHNTIQLVDNVVNDLSQMQNTGRSVFRGVDLAAAYEPVSYLKMYASYAYISRKNISSPDILFTDVPVNKLFASIELKKKERASLVFSGHYSSGSTSASDGSRYSPAYTVFDCHASYSFLKYITARAGLSNIFDKNYSVEEGYPEEGRSFNVSLYFRFEGRKL
jgi:iron complex outermembrane recepter protein